MHGSPHTVNRVPHRRKDAGRRMWRPALVAVLAPLALAAICPTAIPSARADPLAKPPATSNSLVSADAVGASAPHPDADSPPSDWTLPQLLDQLIMVSGQFSDLSASAPEAEAGVGGFVLFGQPPAGSGPSIEGGIAALDAAAADNGQVVPWMSTDEEGGQVQRLADVLGALPSARQMAAQWTPAQVEAVMAAHGAAMRSLGITMDLAPVLDTASPTDTIADEDTRSFSENGQVAAAYGAAYAVGLRSAGVVPVVKHFPGLGHANADTDLGPATDPPLSQLETDDLIPFDTTVADGTPVVMVGHPIVPGLTNGLPASLSPATYTYLRQDLHFQGVALTDSLGAGAISAAGYSEASAAAAAVEAGADMVMIDAADWMPTLSALEQAVDNGELPLATVDTSVERILSAKGESGANLIADADFGQSLGPWQVTPGANWAVYQSSSAAVDGDYLEVNSGDSSSPSLYQDVPVDAPIGQSYRASVLLRTPSSTPIGVSFVVWALGTSPTELGQTETTVTSSSWTRVDTDVDVQGTNATDLRLQLYFSASGADLDIDEATLQDAGVVDAGFGQPGLGPWQVAGGQNWATYSSVTAPVGQSYLETNAGTASGPSVYQDVQTLPLAGHSYQGSVFLRSPQGVPISGTLVLWAIGGPTEVAQTDFTVSSASWTMLTVDVDVADTGHGDLRLQIYFGPSGGADLDVAGGLLEDAGLVDAGFEPSGLASWQVTPGANWQNLNGAGAPAGSSWLQTNTGDLQISSLYQDIATFPEVGHSYTASVYLRSMTGGPIAVAVVLWALGGPTVEMSQTDVTVGSTWQRYSTELDVTDSGHSDLRFQIYLGTPSQTLGVASAQLPDAALYG